MPKKINYLANATLKKAWSNLMAQLLNIERNSLGFILAFRDFCLAFSHYLDTLKQDTSPEEFLNCCTELSKTSSIELNTAQIKQLLTLIESFSSYITSAGGIAAHSYIILTQPYGEEENPKTAKRTHSRSNELLVWVGDLGEYLGRFIDSLPPKQQIKSDQLGLHINEQIPVQLVDGSEDYFIERTLIFMHGLTKFHAAQFYLTKETVKYEIIIRRLIEKSKILLFQRNRPSIDRFIELVKFAASKTDNEELNKIILNFVSSLPTTRKPGSPKLELSSKDVTILLNEQSTYHTKLKKSYVRSIITTRISQDNPGCISIEKKIFELPYLNLSAVNNTEIIYINYTLKFIDDVRQYLAKNQDTMSSNNRYYINHILNMVIKQSYDRETAVLTKMKELRRFFSDNLPNPQEFWDIFATYVDRHKEFYYDPQILLKSHNNRFIITGIPARVDFSEDYFIQHTLFLMHKLTSFLVKEKPTRQVTLRVERLLEKIRELLVQRETPAITRIIELANFLAQNDPLTDELHTIISAFMLYVPPVIPDYQSQDPSKRVKFLKTTFAQHASIYKKLLKNDVPSKIVTFKVQKNQSWETSIEEKMAQLPHLHIVSEPSTNYHEDDFIQETLDFIKKLCFYVIENPNADLMHDRQHEIYHILNQAKALLLKRKESPTIRFKALAEFAIAHDVREKGKLHQIIQGYVAKDPTLRGYSQTKIPVKNRQQFVKAKLLAHNDYSNNNFQKSAHTNKNLEAMLSKTANQVISHLTLNHALETSLLWKIANWFRSRLNLTSSLRIQNIGIKPEEITAEIGKSVTLTS